MIFKSRYKSKPLLKWRSSKDIVWNKDKRERPKLTWMKDMSDGMQKNLESLLQAQTTEVLRASVEQGG